MSINIPTGSPEVFKQLQYYKELTQGAIPTNPAFLNVGVTRDFGDDGTQDDEDIWIHGSRKKYASIPMGSESVISVQHAMIDTKLLRYGTQDPNSAADFNMYWTIAMIEATELNGENAYRMYRQLMTENLTINIDRVPTVTQNFYCPEIEDYMDLAALKTKLGTAGAEPNWAAPLTEEPWVHYTGSDKASTIITVDGQDVDISSMSITLNNNLRKQKPLGWNKARYVRPGNKVINFSIDPWLYDSNYFSKVRLYDVPFTIVVTMRKATPAAVVTLTGCKLNSYNKRTPAGSNDDTMVPVGGKAGDISVSAV